VCTGGGGCNDSSVERSVAIGVVVGIELLCDILEERRDDSGLTEGFGVVMGDKRLLRESDALLGVVIVKVGL